MKMKQCKTSGSYPVIGKELGFATEASGRVVRKKKTVERGMGIGDKADEEIEGDTRHAEVVV